MKKRVFLAFLFLLIAFTVIGGSLGNSSGPIGSGLGAGIAFLCIASYFAYTAWKEKKALISGADAYCKSKIEEGDQYLQSKQKAVDEYTRTQLSDAAAQIDAQKAEADEYSKKKKEEADYYVSSLKKDIETLKAELDAISQETVVKMSQVGDYENLRSDEIKNKLTILKSEQDGAVRSGSAIVIASAVLNKKEITTQSKQILRCFNAECSNIIDAVTVKNVDGIRSKIQRSYDALNKIFASDGVQISKNYLSLKLEELSLVYSYMVKEEEEKEQRRAIKEQMMEEEKVRREIERAKQKIEKEETQFSNEVKKLMSYMQKAKDDVEKQLYIGKIQELEEKLKSLQADKDNVLEREKNTRAGFVYIISNIVSFGYSFFKIGMTRRLEPMDRIAELSSASVPFPFDVHAMIFAEDAPGLETTLHQHFDADRLNKVNPRKEFFRIDLDEIKKVVLENHNATVKFVDVPEAIEYRESKRLEQRASEGDPLAI